MRNDAQTHFIFITWAAFHLFNCGCVPHVYIQYSIWLYAIPTPNKRLAPNLDLSNAPQKASRTSGYNSASTRTKITLVFQDRFGGDPYGWQLDATEAILLGLEAVVIAGARAGKTMPFVMPCYLRRKRTPL